MAWTRVQSNSSVGSTIALSGVAVGNLLVFGAATFSSITALGDSFNTWTKLTEINANGFFNTIWYTVATTGGNLTVTKTGGTFPGMGLIEFHANGTISQAGVVTKTSGSSTTPAAPAITMSTPALTIGGFGSSTTANANWSSSGNYTFDSASGSIYVSGQHFGFAFGYWLAANTSPQSPTLTLSQSSLWLSTGTAFAESPTVFGSGAITLGALSALGVGAFSTLGSGAITLGSMVAAGTGTIAGMSQLATYADPRQGTVIEVASATMADPRQGYVITGSS